MGILTTQITVIELDRVPNIDFLLIDEVINSLRHKEKLSKHDLAFCSSDRTSEV
jgi:hypothetical protein